MQFENAFTVEAPIEQVWSYLLDVPSVAPCVPGAQLTEILSPGEFKGTVRVKLGAVQMSYRGTLTVKEADETARRVVLTATGTETRGTGGASGTVTSTLTEEGPSLTQVHMSSEIMVTGRVAQFGRNIMQDVADRLIRDFAKCLEQNISARDGAEVPPAVGTPSGRGRVRPQPPPNLIGSSAAVPEPSVSGPVISAGHHVAAPSGVEGGGAELVEADQAGTEVKLLPLMADIMRSRLARLLRTAAHAVDPDDS